MSLYDPIAWKYEHQGFRRRRSYKDAIFAVQKIVKKSLEFTKPASLCFRTAPSTWYRSPKRRYSNLIMLIADVYSKNEIKIKSDGVVSPPIPTSRSVKQAYSLGQFLFNLIMN